MREEGKMIKIIFGSLLLIIFGLASLGASLDFKSSEAELTLIISLICTGLGALLIYLGSRDRKRWKAIKELAILMIKTNGKINSKKIAQDLSLNNIIVVGYLAKLRKKGFLPNNTKLLDQNIEENSEIVQQCSEGDGSEKGIVNSEEAKMRIKELTSLFKEGIISKEEFNQKKEAIVNINRS